MLIKKNFVNTVYIPVHDLYWLYKATEDRFWGETGATIEMECDRKAVRPVCITLKSLYSHGGYCG